MLDFQSRELLKSLSEVDNPSEYLSQRFSSVNGKDRDKLRGMIHELVVNEYITVFWADNIPYHTEITHAGRVYEETVLVNEAAATNISINIGDNNRISKSNIIGNSIKADSKEEKRFWEKHPFILAVITAVIASFIMMFSFWDKLVVFFEGLF